MTTMLMLLACTAAWALVALMLGEASPALRRALTGRPVQGGGWMPASARAGVAARAFTRA